MLEPLCLKQRKGPWPMSEGLCPKQGEGTAPIPEPLCPEQGEGHTHMLQCPSSCQSVWIYCIIKYGPDWAFCQLRN